MFFRKLFSFATVTLIVALTLSGIAAWYSVQGLTAIFAAAVVPITIMGGSLEIAKVITTVWLHRYWHRAAWRLKLYLVPAVIALAFLTSMGIFGFLSKAHSDQSLVGGDVAAKVAIYDEKIKTAQDNIDTNRKALQQMDAQVDQLLGRTTDDKGANRAVQVRKQQRAERTRIQNEIAADQETISKLNEEAAPIRAQIRKVEAEVGPIKYIAALIYGDNPDSNLLERAVRWVIILIVFVFDPLALTLVLAAQSSYEWLEEDLKKKDEDEADEKFNETFANSKGSIDPAIDLEKMFHGKCGTPECCGECDTAVDQNLPEQDIESENEHNVTEDSDPVEEHKDVTEEETIVQEEEHPEESTDAKEIVTEGVTFHETESGYIQYDGKSVSKTALLGMHPELFAAKPDSEQSSTSFGTEFPKFAHKGDLFVRVDMLPNRVFKFDSVKWIEVNKSQTDSYLYNEEYIKHLVNKIEVGEYDIELLSDNERAQIEEYLQNSQN